MILTCTIEGRCVPWQRAGGRGSRRYTPAGQRDYQRLVEWSVRCDLPRGWPLDARYAVEVIVYEPDAHRRDLDNEIKTCFDALNGVTWADDSQIDAVAVLRRLDRERPRVVMTIATMTLLERDRATVTIDLGGAA